MGYIGGVHLLPATGEFTYDTIAYSGARAGAPMQPLNTYYAPGGAKTDYSYAIDQLQAAHPECTTVGVVCAWFANSLDASTCQIYPATTYAGGAFQSATGADMWRVSGLTQTSAGLISLPVSGGDFVYGGTPSDQSVVRCLRDLKSRGFRVIFYPFLLMTASGLPWRGEITFTPDVSATATKAVTAFLGSAAPSQFTPDPVGLTVAYAGAPTDYSYRRMILHYAWLCTIAGGVDLFLLGSELRGLETIRGPGWTPAGVVDSAGHAAWDYPFVAGLAQLAADVRSVFDGQGLTKTLTTLKNLVAYSADWSDWMGYQHAGANGQWPHLDALWSSGDIDLVGIDNYLPLSDWTTGSGGLDAVNWVAPAPTSWPPTSGSMSGLGLTGTPTLYSLPYLQANIEGGEKFNWYYADSANGTPALDPNGADLQVSSPSGDRLAQARSAYAENQQILANKQYRWWWSNPHQAIYDAGDGLGWAPHGPATAWAPQSKSLAFLEYGVPAIDKGTNQPNVYFDPKSSASGIPYWSAWAPAPGGGLAPLRDETISGLALQAIYQYWTSNGRNAVSASGTPLLQLAFSCVWNWDARPFPTFPQLSSVWSDASNWNAGTWVNGQGPALPPLAPSADPAPGVYPTFPTLAALGWSLRIAPGFATTIADHVSGRSLRHAAFAFARYTIELVFNGLRADEAEPDLETIAGFFASLGGRSLPFWFAPPGLGVVTGQGLGTGDGRRIAFPFMRSIGGYSEPVGGVSAVSAVYLNGTAQAPGSWSVTMGYAPAITFVSAPAVGAIVSADFEPLWLCRFEADQLDSEEVLAMLFALRSVKLVSVQP